MNFIVCIKQVPATTDVKIDSQTNTLKREGVEAIVNPFDNYAIEESLMLKERIGGKVTVLTMGPPQAEKALREAISMGVDEGVLLSDRAFAGADTLATSYTLSQAIKKVGRFDLILCGKQAIDGDTAQVGPGIAEKLGIPHIAYVRKIEEIKPGYIRVERMMEDGFDILESTLPALITVVKEINIPRMPSLRGMMASKRATIPVWNAQAIEADPNKIGLTGSPTWVYKVFSPPPRGGGEVITGDPAEQARKLVAKLREMKVI
ncbi:MAG: electron transfer flavoprotein subunit beta/FixA family protein [Elusimicrobiota bacterium]